MDGFRRHLTYANVIATLALIVAVAGGTAAVAGNKAPKKADVTSKGKIRAGRVTTPKLADSAVTASKLADGAVSSAKVADHNVTATDLAGTENVVETGTGRVTANCGPGERLESGGASTGTDGSLAAFGPTFPNGIPSGWSATATGGGTVTVIAVCLKATPGP